MKDAADLLMDAQRAMDRDDVAKARQLFEQARELIEGDFPSLRAADRYIAEREAQDG